MTNALLFPAPAFFSFPLLPRMARNARDPGDDSAWLARFHAGERAVLEECYRLHFARALAAAARVLTDVDAETVTHEIFCRLLGEPSMRASFGGGNLGAWVSSVAGNAAIDFHRRRRREVSHEPDDSERAMPDGEGDRATEEADAKMLVERFVRERLPEKWRGVFEARFLRQLPQRAAASELGIERSTLAYQEQQVRALLTTFILSADEP